MNKEDDPLAYWQDKGRCKLYAFAIERGNVAVGDLSSLIIKVRFSVSIFDFLMGIAKELDPFVKKDPSKREQAITIISDLFEKWRQISLSLRKVDVFKSLRSHEAELEEKFDRALVVAKAYCDPDSFKPIITPIKPWVSLGEWEKKHGY